MQPLGGRALQAPAAAGENDEGMTLIPPGRIIGEVTIPYLRPPDRRTLLRSYLLEATEERLVTAHRYNPPAPLRRAGEIVLDVDYWAVWFLFKNRPYDVGRVYRPDGTWTGYYVDVLEPVRWRGADPSTLEPVVDLFLDLWIEPDGRYVILDEDEFEGAEHLGHIAWDQAQRARTVLRQLVREVEGGTFPPAPASVFRL